MAFRQFAHALCAKTKSTVVLRDNKSITRFFQTKALPPALWNACVYVLQSKFRTQLSYQSRTQNYGEDRSLVPVRPADNTHLVDNIPLDVTDEEQFFFTEADIDSQVKIRDLSKEREILASC